MRRIVGSLTVVVLLAVMKAAVAAQLPPGGTFLDDDLNVHEGYIEALVSVGVTFGCEGDPPLFCPDRAVTRAETAVLLLRATGSLDDSTPYLGLFKDVPEDRWFSSAVEQATLMGVMDGFDNGFFRPDDPVSRWELAVHLVGLLGAGEELGPATGQFMDVSQKAWYASHVDRLVELGLTRGCSDDPPLFCPNQTVTRGEMATFLARMLGLDPIVPPPRAPAPDPTTTTTPTTTPTTSPSTTVPATTTTTCPPAADL